MIKIENTEVVGWEHAIRGMRNPMNSWDRSDSKWEPQFDTVQGPVTGEFIIGPNDHELMMRLAKAGPVHAKYRRMITVYVDITAPLYWWKEMDQYRVGQTTNSCSTMHKIAEKEFTLEDFSCEHLMEWSDYEDEAKQFAPDRLCNFKFYMMDTIVALNNARELYLKTKDKKYWWQMIQLLPSSYNQKRTVMLNYEVLANIYKSRRTHKLDEWVEFCKWVESLLYSELITGQSLDDLPICNKIMEDAKKKGDERGTE